MNNTPAFPPSYYEFVYSVHRAALSCCALSFFISLSIIVTLAFFPKLRTHRLWVLVIGVSVGDAMSAFHHGIDHALSLTDLNAWPVDGPLCRWLAVGTIAGFWYTSAWILSIAGSLLYTFMHDVMQEKKNIPLPILFAFTSAMFAIPWIIGLAIGAFGPAAPFQPTWCSFVDIRYENYFYDYWVLIFSFLLFGLYIALTVRFLHFGSNARRKALKSIRRIIFFPCIYTLQWFPYVVYSLMVQTGVVPSVELVLAVVVLANSGGMLNGVFYFGFLILASRLKISLTSVTIRSSEHSSSHKSKKGTN